MPRTSAMSPGEPGALTSIAAAQDALDLGDRVTGILARVRDPDKAGEVGRAVMHEITDPPLWANDWIRHADGASEYCFADATQRPLRQTSLLTWRRSPIS